MANYDKIIIARHFASSEHLKIHLQWQSFSIKTPYEKSRFEKSEILYHSFSAYKSLTTECEYFVYFQEMLYFKS